MNRDTDEAVAKENGLRHNSAPDERSKSASLKRPKVGLINLLPMKKSHGFSMKKNARVYHFSQILHVGTIIFYVE